MSVSKLTVCVVTGTRAEYGLLKPLIQLLCHSPKYHLQLVVTGMHLSPEFGLTRDQIEQDNLHIDREIEILLSSDTPSGLTKSMGVALISFADVFNQLSPDVVVVLGDRFEILAASIAAFSARIPIAHCHGGEVTEAALDDAFRHSITKMSSIHFVSNDTYRKRVIQLGEHPSTVHNVGGLGVDAILRTKLISLHDVCERLGLDISEDTFLITYHPETLSPENSQLGITSLLAALDTVPNHTLIFTMPNADSCGREIMAFIRDFCRSRHNAHWFSSLGNELYYSLIPHVSCVIGNSSSGISEVPSFKRPTINIGDRQKGRLRASSVIDCDSDYNSILAALRILKTPAFASRLEQAVNPYGDGGATQRILDVLDTFVPSTQSSKRFFDIPLT